MGTHRCCSAAVGLGSCCRRAISLYEAMRWRGVSVMSRLGQLLSQKPHSMQWSTISEATGDGFRCLMCRLGSCRCAARYHLDSAWGQAHVNQLTCKCSCSHKHCRQTNSQITLHVWHLVQHDARVEHIVRVEQRLEAPHQVVRLASPLHLDIRRHVAAGAVLTLQGSVDAEPTGIPSEISRHTSTQIVSTAGQHCHAP